MSLSTAVRDQSYAAIQDELGDRQREVFIALSEMTVATAWDLAARLKRDVYVVRPRITELRNKGFVVEAGLKWHEGTQRNETAWQVNHRLNHRNAA